MNGEKATYFGNWHLSNRESTGFTHKRGISQAQLAHLLDVSTGFIGHVEIAKDRAKYNLNMLVKLKEILECDYNDLLP